LGLIIGFENYEHFNRLLLTLNQLKLLFKAITLIKYYYFYSI